MKNISVEELNEILEKHEIWLRGEEGGERADLSDADLRGFDLSDTNLSYAYLNDANLSDADLRDANLMGADLSGVDLRNADLSDTNLRNADLRNANLRNADLMGADLRCTDSRCANLSDADLRGANLKNVKTNINTIGYNLACPEEGSFIGYKRASGCMVKLLILDDAKRSSATTYKCRCDKAKVLDIENIKTGEKVEEVKSSYDSEFIYRVGKIVTVEDFDENRWNECSTGIHFFVNKENALNY